MTERPIQTQVPTPAHPGPRPLALHLAVQTLALTSSMAALPLLRNGSLAWKQGLPHSPASLMEAISRTTPEAFAAALQNEIAQRLNTFIAGIQRYQGAARPTAMPDAPTIWQDGPARLLDYGAVPEAADPGGPVVLVVPSLVNRGYVLDLAPKRSLLRHLAAEGLRPLLIDWGAPGETERAYTLTDYIAGPLQSAFEKATALATDSGKTKPAVIGYCMGGNLALALAARNPGRTGALALLATPWDFQAGQDAYLPMLAAMAPALDAMIGALGVLPTDMLQAMFMGLNPDGVGHKYRRFADLAPSSKAAREFVALEDWLNDGVPLAGPVARECLLEWYLQNTPAKGTWRVAGKAVDPAAIDAPTLVVIPDADYIVPPESARPLAALIPDATLETLRAGHIGMVAGSRAATALYQPLATWLRRHVQ